MGRYAGVRAHGRGYEASWRDGTGRQVSKSGFAREKDAHDFRVKQLASLGRGAYVDPQQGRLTVGEQYDKWRELRRVSRGRAAAEDSYASNHFLPRWKDVRLEAVTDEDAQAWVNELSERLAARTVIECYRLLKSTLDAAVRAKRRADNPAQFVKPPPIPTRKLTHDDVLDAGELAAVIRATAPRWRALVLLVGWIGPRLGEALGVRRCDVNLLRGTVTFGRVVVEEVHGKPGPRLDGKNENAERVVPLPASVKAALEAHMATYVGTDPGAFLFLQESGRHPSRGNLLRHVLKPAVAVAGISASTTVRRKKGGAGWLVEWHDPKGKRSVTTLPDKKAADELAATTGGGRRITFRQLRHSAASIQFDEGVDPLAVSQWLGHYAPSFTLDTYTHLLKRAEQAGTEAIDKAMREAGEDDDPPALEAVR